MITQKHLEKIVMEEVAFVEEKFMSAKFRKAIEKYQDLQLKQQQLQKAFVGTKDAKQREKLKKALIKMHYVVKKAEAEFNSALHIEPVEFEEAVEKPRAQVNESTGLVAIIDLHDCEVEHPGIAHKAWSDQQLAESTKSYGDSLVKIARDKQLKMLSKKDKETLLKIAALMKKMKEGTLNVTEEQSGILKEKAQGLWANIKAKQDRGEKPAPKGSKAYNDAVAAGKEINNEAALDEVETENDTEFTVSLDHLLKKHVTKGGEVKEGKLTEIKKGDWVRSAYDELGLVKSVKGQAAYVSFDGSRSFDPMRISDLKKTSERHKGKAVYSEGKLTEAKDRKLDKLFQRSRAVTAKSGEDKLYKLSQDWEDWNVDNDDKYDDLVDHLFAAVELVQDAGTVKDKEYYSYMKSADKHLKTFTKDVTKAMKLHKEGVVAEMSPNAKSEDKIFPRKPSEKKVNKDIKEGVTPCGCSKKK